MSDEKLQKTNQNDDMDNIEYIRVGRTTYEVASFYGGTMSLTEIIKNALKRDAQAVLRQMESNG